MKAASLWLPLTALLAACAPGAGMAPAEPEPARALPAFAMSRAEAEAALAAVPPVPPGAARERPEIRDFLTDGRIAERAWPGRTAFVFLRPDGRVWRVRLDLGGLRACHGPVARETAQGFVARFAPAARPAEVETAVDRLLDEAQPFPRVTLAGAEFALARRCIAPLIATAR